MDGTELKPYVLVYYINEYPEMGGGLQFERFKKVEELDARVIEIYNAHDILLVGKVQEFKYEEVTKVTNVKRVEE